MIEKQRFCKLYGKCTSCTFVNEKYEDELFEKYLIANKWLKRFAKVRPLEKAPDICSYRCKVQATCGYDKNGRFVTGQYKSGTHELIPIANCILEDPRATEILASIRGFANRYGIHPYDEDTGHGDLRHILIRLGYNSNQIMVVLVAARPDFPGEYKLVKSLTDKYPDIKTVVEIVNREKTNMVIPDNAKETVLYGSGYIVDIVCNLKFSISAKSFYQINPQQAELLYDIAMDMANLQKSDTVIDAYCGTGTIGLIASTYGVKSVIGIESNPDAVEDAKYNAKLNYIENVHFINADAAKELKKMQKEGQNCNILFLDPPRSGSSEEFLASASKMNPDAIIYISCNPETLSRDLRYLIHFTPYRVTAIQPVDMFPGTEHIETVVLLSRI